VAEEPTGPTAPRIRALTAPLAAALAHGRKLSPTLQELIIEIQRTDVIVHLDERWARFGHVRGDTQLLSGSPRQRYLRITVDARVRGPALVGLLSHELWHAWKIAQHPWVDDNRDVAQLYRQIGNCATERDGMFRVDTAAARSVERRVLSELRERRLSLPLADLGYH
jgi:hypothetical protein